MIVFLPQCIPFYNISIPIFEDIVKVIEVQFSWGLNDKRWSRQMCIYVAGVKVSVSIAFFYSHCCKSLFIHPCLIKTLIFYFGWKYKFYFEWVFFLLEYILVLMHNCCNFTQSILYKSVLLMRWWVWGVISQFCFSRREGTCIGSFSPFWRKI